MGEFGGPALIKSPIGVGDRVPEFTLPNQSGMPVVIPQPLPTILVFFRGQW
jgi:peroxiredoxin